VTDTPELTPEQRDVLEKIIRVDQAGELGANYIYYGQKAVFAAGSDKRTAAIVQVRPDVTFGSRQYRSAP
jgi:ubiquinone biosynthesis monooxygenase Coq7